MKNIFVLCSILVSIVSLFGTVDGASIVSRSTRQATTTQQARHQIELLVITDESMNEFHGANLRAHYLHIVSWASYYLSLLGPYQPTIPRARLERHRLLNVVLVPGRTIDDTLHAFRKWHLNTREMSSSSQSGKFDAVLLLTRKQFSGALGVTYSQSICTAKSYAIATDLDDVELGTYVIAHELAHLIGMQHYNSQQCSEYYHSRGLPIPDTQPEYGWNSCDRHLVTKYLETNGKCLLETNVHH